MTVNFFPVKQKTVQARFSPDEMAILQELSKRTGFTISEIVRRSLRLVRQEMRKRGNINFLLEETAPKAAVSGAVAEQSPPYGQRQKKS